MVCQDFVCSLSHPNSQFCNECFGLFVIVCKGSGTSQTTDAFTSLVVNLLSVVLPRPLAFASASQMLVRQCGVTPNYVQVNTVA